jgi:hypothetical protein
MQSAKSKKKAEVTASTPMEARIVVGLDVGDRKSHYCRLDQEGVISAEGSVLTKESALRSEFEGKPRMRIALEAGSHSPWISRLLAELGHEVIVANARNLRMISDSDGKNVALMLGCWRGWRGSGQIYSVQLSTDPRKFKLIYL